MFRAGRRVELCDPQFEGWAAAGGCYDEDLLSISRSRCVTMGRMGWGRFHRFRPSGGLPSGVVEQDTWELMSSVMTTMARSPTNARNRLSMASSACTALAGSLIAAAQARSAMSFTSRKPRWVL